jgi:hypothetical protein
MSSLSLASDSSSLLLDTTGKSSASSVIGTTSEGAAQEKSLSMQASSR